MLESFKPLCKNYLILAAARARLNTLKLKIAKFATVDRVDTDIGRLIWTALERIVY